MNKIFYAIYNKEENKFLSIYEDGEGNEYYSAIELSEFSYVGNPLFKDENNARSKLEEAKRIAKYSRTIQNLLENAGDFLKDAKIIPIQVSVRFDLITEE